jgi:hypothetical protein
MESAAAVADAVANNDADVKQVPCAYCGTTVVGTAFVLCAACEVPLHRDCWTEGGRCPAFACGSTAALDPALAIFRRPRTTSGSITTVVTPAKPGTAPATAAAQPAPVARGPEAGSGGILSRLWSLVKIASGDKRISAVSIDVHLDGRGATSWLPGFWRRLRGRGPTMDPEVARVKALAADPYHEARLIERELRDARLRKWVRWMGLLAGFIMMPLVLKLVSKMLVFPMVAGLLAWATWPGWTTGAARRQRALARRLDELYLLQAAAMEPEGPRS